MISKHSLALLAMLVPTAFLHSTTPSQNTSGAPIDLPPSTAQVRVLPNGLTVIVDEDHSAPVASVQAWCGTGSIHEGHQLGAGLSHILEHMLFKGTETRKAGEIARQIQEQGGYINAYTTFDRTVYWIDIPSSGVKDAIDILCDAMMNSTLPPDEYEKEQEVIRREFAMGFDDPSRMSSQLMFRTVFQQSPYRHPVIGHLDIYNKLTRDDVMAYYKERYVPNNLVIVVTGDVNADEIFSQVEKEFSKYPRHALEPIYIPEEPEQLGRREAHEEFPTELTRLSLAWRIPGITNPDVPALDLLAAALGDGRSSPLYQIIREQKGLAHAVMAGTYTPEREGIFVVQAITDPAHREAVEKEILSVIQDVQEKGVSAKDLERARKSFLSGQLAALETARGKASDLASNWFLTRNLDFSREYLKRIASLTSDDLKNVARKYLTESRLNVTSLNPPGSLAANTKKDEQAAKREIRKFTLENGLRVLVCEDSRLPLVSIVAAFRGGLLAETPATNGITTLLTQTIIKGTKTRSAQDIADAIETVGGSIGSDSGNNSFTVSVSLMKPDLRLGMELLADILQNASYPEAEVAREKQAQIAAIKAEEDQITTVARNALRSNLFGDHPYALRAKGTRETVESLTPDQLRAMHRELVTARNGVIAIFGDVKFDEVRSLAEKFFSGLPEGKLAFADAPVATWPTSPKIVEEIRDKQQAVIMVGFPGLSILDPDRPVLELIDTASSDLGSRFFDRIREQKALAYYVGASHFSGLAPGVIAFYLGTDPAKLDLARTEFKDEIEKLAREGLTQEELDRAKKKLLGAEVIRNQGISSFAASSAINELVGLGYDHDQRRTEEIQAVTVEDTRRVAQKLLGASGSVETIVRPEKSAHQP